MSANKSELIHVLGEVKARVQDKLGEVDFPMPQFILIGKQSVGKSRLIETLAGECFNFTSGTLGSRRPTVLEFRNDPKCRTSRWFVRNRQTNQWEEHHIQSVMRIVGDAHEELGETVSPVPIYVRVESSACCDMLIVDLPGFREFAMDGSKQALSDSIVSLVEGFMKDRRNVMLCVEQAGDAATMSTLARCRRIDPRFERTILIRNKLDKYYSDLTPDNINRWADGYGDLPDTLVRFALTLPWWQDGTKPGRPFQDMRDEQDECDRRTIQGKGLNPKHMSGIGFRNFAAYMEKKLEQLFAEAIVPVLTNLQGLKEKTARRQVELQTERSETDQNKILSTTRDCGASFATALAHVMEGVLSLSEARMTLDQELREFHAHHQALGSEHLAMLPSDDFSSLDDYIGYLRDEIQICAFDVEVNGGAQFRRMMTEVEIFLRFSDISVETTKRDLLQAMGVSMSSIAWRDVIVKLLSNEAHHTLQRRVHYVGERIRWFFERQKDAVVEFMANLEGTPSGRLYSPLYPKHVKLIKQNDMIRQLIYRAFDAACKRQLQQFNELFDTMLTSTFSNPWVFLRNVSDGGDLGDVAAPSFDEMKELIPKEAANRSGVEGILSKWLQDIPTDSSQIDVAVEKVQIVVLKTYGFIRSQVCDQVELFAESFFKVPMLRRLEEDMSLLELSEADKDDYQLRRQRLGNEIKTTEVNLIEVEDCIRRLRDFKLRCETRRD